MQNKKIQLWALSTAGYNCTIDYMAGITNTCADLLSRRPDEPGHCQEKNLTEELDLNVNDNTFKVGVINSNEFEPKKFASCDIPFDDSLVKPDDCLPVFDVINEQNKDDEFLELKTILVHGKHRTDVHLRYLVVDNVEYYLTDPDGDTVLRLYVHKHLRALVTRQYYDDNRHMGVQKTLTVEK